MISIFSLILSRNMCKLHHKLRYAKIYPLEVPIYKLFYSMSFHGQFRKLFHVSEPTLSKQFFSKLEFLFSVLGSMVSKNICKLRHKLKNSKNLPELTWSWQNKPWSMVYSSVLYYVVLYYTLLYFTRFTLLFSILLCCTILCCTLLT